MRRANRKDVVQSEIVKGLRERGIVVFDMPQPGDVLCYGLRHGTVLDPDDMIWMPMELKSDKRTRGYKPELTKAQITRAATGAVIPIVHSLAEALALFGRTE